MKEVTSLSNPVVKDIRALALKKFRDSQDAFMAEGLKLVIDALDLGWTIRTLVFAKSQKGNAAMHSALMTHSVTHWTIAAALRPHAGYSEAMAHKTISTGISKATVAFHDDIDVSRWFLYANQVVYTGRGTTQSEGRVYAEDGRLVASYAVHGMIRPLVRRPGAPDMVL